MQMLQTFVGPFADAIQASTWLQVDVLVLLAVLLPVLVKGVLQFWGPWFLWTEVALYTVAAVVVGLVPMPVHILILLFGMACAYGAYRRQHSRHVLITRSDHARTVTRPLEAAVGLSDVLFVALAATTLQCLRAQPGWGTYLFAMLAQIPIMAGLVVANSEIADVEVKERKTQKRSDSLVDRPSKGEVAAATWLPRLQTFSLLYLGTAPLLAVVLFAELTPGWLVIVAGAGVIATWAIVFAPQMAARRRQGDLRQAIAEDDIPALLRLQDTPKMGVAAQRYLAERAENDGPSFAEKAYGYLLDPAIDLKLRLEKLGEAYYGNDLLVHTGEILVRNSRWEDLQRLMQQVEGAADRYVAWNLSAEVLDGLVDDMGDGRLKVYNMDLLKAALSWMCDPARELTFRVGMIEAMAHRPGVAALPDVQRVLKEAKEDPDIVRVLELQGVRLQ